MRNPWLRLALYAGIALTLHFMMSVTWWVFGARHHKAVRSDRVVARSPAHLRVWITGDSHPRTAIDPRVLGPDVVNAAVGGQNMVKSYYRTQKLVERYGKTIETLIVPLDAVTLTSWNADVYAPEVVWGRYVDFLEVGRVRDEPIRYLGYWVEAHVAPYMGELRTLNQLRAGRFGFGDGIMNGNFGLQPPSKRAKTAREAAESHLAGGVIVDPTQRWALASLVDWAENRDIRVVFIRFPVTRLYASHLGNARDEIDEAVVGSIVDPERHLILDHEALLYGRDKLFSDSHHLNLVGRALYSRWLRRELVAQGVL